MVGMVMNNDYFSLNGPCKDCPFRKDQNYLKRSRMEEIIDYVRSHDKLFPCHKTVEPSILEEVDELNQLIDDEVESMVLSENDKVHFKSQLKEQYQVNKMLEDGLSKAKACAGLLIVSIKSDILLNNFLLRLALMHKFLDLNQFKNTDLIDDSIYDSINKCRN